MDKLSTHPALVELNAYYERIRNHERYWEVEKPASWDLGQRLRHLLELDPTAVYKTVYGSTLVYYHSMHADPLPDGHCTRIVLKENGEHRRFDKIGFDPR